MKLTHSKASDAFYPELERRRPRRLKSAALPPGGPRLPAFLSLKPTRTPALRWCLAGSLAVAMELAAGLYSARSAEATFDYFQNSWSVIGLKDYDEGTRITPENELVLAGKTRLRFSCGQNLTPLSRRQTKTLLDGWLPIVLLVTEEDGRRPRPGPMCG